MLRLRKNTLAGRRHLTDKPASQVLVSDQSGGRRGHLPAKADEPLSLEFRVDTNRSRQYSYQPALRAARNYSSCSGTASDDLTRKMGLYGHKSSLLALHPSPSTNIYVPPSGSMKCGRMPPRAPIRRHYKSQVVLTLQSSSSLSSRHG